MPAIRNDLQRVRDAGHANLAGRPRYLAPTVAAVGLRTSILIITEIFAGTFLFLDEQNYDRVGWILATDWHRHAFPSPQSYALGGALNSGYYVYVAAIFFIFGHQWLFVKLSNVILSSLATLPAAGIGEALGGPQLARRAAWAVALYPVGVFWGSTGLKDGPLATGFLVLLLLGLRPISLPRVLAQVSLVAMTFYVRPALAACGLITMVVPIWKGAAARRRSGRLFQTASGRRVARLVAVAMMAATPLLLSPYAGYLHINLSSEAAASGVAGVSVPQLYPSPVIRAMLGPFPWEYGSETENVTRALYPGMVVWILLLPAISVGAWFLLRRGNAATRGMLLAILSYLLFYLASSEYVQGAFRQRFVVESALIIVALLAFDRQRYWAQVATAVGVVVLAPAILIQTDTLSATWIALLVVSWGAGSLFGRLLLLRIWRAGTGHWASVVLQEKNERHF